LDLGKFHNKKVNKGSEVEQSYSYILYLTLALDGGRAHYMPAALLQERDLVSGVQEAGWAPGLLWTCVENLTPTGSWTVDYGKILWNSIGDEK
jgi:hypothetical protein